MTKVKGLFGDVELKPAHQTPSHNRRYKDYTDDWPEIAHTCLLLANFICRDCGKPANQPHHILPLSKGGTNSQQNLAALCFHCHSKNHKYLGRRKIDKSLAKSKKLF